jgi:chromosome segregation ATPase
MYDQWLAEKNQFATEKLTLEQALEFAHKENTSLHAKQDSLSLQLQDREVRIDELHRLHKQAQENLEHYRESAREQRLLDQQQFEQQKQQLQIEIKNFNEQSMAQRDKISVLQQQNQTLSLSYSTLEKNNSHVQLLLEEAHTKLHEAEKKAIEHLDKSIHWQNQYNESQNKLDLKINQFIDIQTENKIIFQKQTELKQSLKDFQEQNKLLIHEKWELSQEKSHLEGRLRQMQEMINV